LKICGKSGKPERCDRDLFY